MTRYDIAIAGGGPAGTTAAVLLARAGARVALVDAGQARARLEGLSLRAMEILRRLDLAPPGVAPAVARRALWGEMNGTPNREHLVERRAFDAALRRQAARQGVKLVTARITGLRPAQGRLLLNDSTTLEAGLLVEARGRQAPVASGRLRGPGAVAVAGWSGRAEAPGAEIAARRDGWLWRAAPAPGPVWTQIVVEARALAPGAQGLAAAWARFFDGLGASLPEQPLVRAAELRLTAPELDPALPRLGDAAVALDPLSGHGLFWALSSALAAPPLLAALFDGEEELARRFYRDRVAETFWRQARIGRDFHRLAGIASPFWAARSCWPDGQPAHPRAAEPRLRRQVVVREGRLVEAEALVTTRDPGGVAFVHGREIAPILRRIGAGPLPERAAFQARVLPEALPEEAAAIHDWLLHRGFGTAGTLRQVTTTETTR